MKIHIENLFDRDNQEAYDEKSRQLVGSALGIDSSSAEWFSSGDISGLDGRAMDHVVFEELYRLPSVDCVRWLRQAAQAIDPENGRILFAFPVDAPAVEDLVDRACLVVDKKVKTNDGKMMLFSVRRLTRREVFTEEYFTGPPGFWWSSDNRYKMLADLTRSAAKAFGIDSGIILDVSQSSGRKFFSQINNDVIGAPLPYACYELAGNLVSDPLHPSDVVVCWNALEHSDPIDIPVILKNIKSINPKLFLVTVGVDEAREAFCVRPRAWWRDRFEEAGFLYLGDHSAFNDWLQIWGNNEEQSKKDMEGFFVLSALPETEIIKRLWKNTLHKPIHREDPRQHDLAFLVNEVRAARPESCVGIGVGIEQFFSSFVPKLQTVDVCESATAKFNTEWEIPIESHSVDFVYSLRYLQHLPAKTQRRIVSEVARILRPGGRCFIQMWPLSEVARQPEFGNEYLKMHAVDAPTARDMFHSVGLIVESIRPVQSGGRVISGSFAPILQYSSVAMNTNETYSSISERSEPDGPEILVVGVTSVDNGHEHQYPFIGTVTSATRICDRILVRCGGKLDENGAFVDDGTYETLKKEYALNPNIVIIQDTNEYKCPFRETKQTAIDEARKLFNAKWFYWFDIDEVAADEDSKRIRDHAKNNSISDIILFREVMFWEDYGHILYDDGRAAHAFLIRNKKRDGSGYENIEFEGDGFQIKEKDKNVNIDRTVKVYHYGICKELSVLLKKRNNQSATNGGTGTMSAGATWDDIGRELFPSKSIQVVEVDREAPSIAQMESKIERVKVPALVSNFHVDRLLPFLGSHPVAMRFGAPRQKRVGIIRSAGHGDHIMSEPTIRAIHNAYKSMGYDIAIDYYITPVYKEFTLMYHSCLSATRNNLMAMHEFKPDLLVWLERATDARQTRPVVDAFLGRWAEFLPSDQKSPKIPTDVSHEQVARQVRNKVGQHFLVGVAMGTTDQKKGPLQADYMNFVQNLLDNEQIFVIIMGEAGEVNTPPREFLKDHPRLLNVVGQQSLQQCIGTTMACDMVVSNDSASHHIAGALGVPCIGIFTAFNAEFLSAYYKNFIPYQCPISCSPCYRHRDQECKSLDCLRSIEWDKITEWVMDAQAGGTKRVAL